MSAISNQLEVHARFRPRAEALFDADTGRRFTYGELHALSLRWTSCLRRHGVVRGDRVAVLAHNRGEAFAVLYACAELGATFFPMNWRLAPAELRWQLDHARPRALLVDAAHAAFESEIPRLSLELDPEDAPAAGEGAVLSDPWMLLYTSGTSGRPKGALITHQQVHWNAVNTVLACDLTADASTLTFTPLFHTGGLNCLSTPMLHIGGRIVLRRGVDPGRDLRLVAAERITHLMGVPTIYQMLADDPQFEQADLTCVVDALCGGAPLSVDLLNRYLERKIPLRQGFGLTEVGPNCFSMPHADQPRKLGSVGKLIHHLSARLLRPDGTDCADGEAGELCFAGPTVFGGYLDAPDATAASFHGEWFRTGDVLTRDDEGFYWVSGRQKEMYKSGGENVYPAEVEAAIYRIHGVAQVAVLGVPDERWGEVGHAFVEPAPGVHLDGEQIRAALGEHLGRFKIPKQVTVEASLPRTGAGKIDKVALAARLQGGRS